MAAKNCPGCRKQVPVACKKCTCGHFFTSRRPLKAKGKKDEVDIPKKEKTSAKGTPLEFNGDDEDIPLETLRQLKHEEADLPRRRTGRIQREKPHFYDALEYDNLMRKKMRLLKGKGKTEEGVTKESGTPILFDETPHKDSKPDATPGPKKRRGRPPRLTTKGTKTSKAPVPLPLNNKAKRVKHTSGGTVEPYEDLMKNISPEKALHYNIILEDINRKWAGMSWRI